MSYTEYLIQDFQTLIQPLVGLSVSLPWKGIGSAVFLELGDLAPLKSTRQYHNEGDACIAVEWDWRVEAESIVLYGSSNSRPAIATGIAALRGTTIQKLSIEGKVPELVVQFSNGHCLRSMAMLPDAPVWSIKLPDKTWIHAKDGGLLVGDCALGTTETEIAIFALAERTASRWGIPIVEPKRGACADCFSFVPIDGDGHFLDYGACIAESGPLDGHIVSLNSGCPSFLHKEGT